MPVFQIAHKLSYTVHAVWFVLFLAICNTSCIHEKDLDQLDIYYLLESESIVTSEIIL